MDCLTAISASLVTRMFEYTIEPVGRRLSHLYSFGRNIDNLNYQKRELESLNSAVEQRVEDAERRGEEIKDDVQVWLSRVDGLLKSEAVVGVLRDEVAARCSMGRIFPNPILRYRLSKEAKEVATMMINEIQLEGKFERVSRMPAIINKDFMAFETRMSVFEGIMEALKKANVAIIGMYGMGGIGKTMLAKEIARKAKRDKLFSKVIMVTISQTPDVDKIQREIAAKLHVDITKETTPSARADRLRQELSKENNILIILDDIWKEINLLDIGVPFGDQYQNGCKILLTSRSHDLVHNFMGSDKDFMVEALSKEESTELFSKLVGDLDGNDAYDFERLLPEIIGECAGLPVALTTLACALKGKRFGVWKNALHELKNSAPTNIEGVSERVYSCIKLSFDFLESEEAKSLLLLCSMHEEDKYISVKKLLMYSVGWGFLEGIHTLEQAGDRVSALIDKLTANCLLLPVDGLPVDDQDRDYFAYGGVKMHDVVRDVAISIASKDRKMFNIATTIKFEEWLREGKLNDSTTISLLDEVNFSKLPPRLACSQLTLFFMFHFVHGALQEIPDHFFEEPEKLRALELRSVSLHSPPSPFSSLKNLQTLCLNRCDITDTAFIGGLINLKILDLSGSTFYKLSKQIGQLTRLLLLDLSDCRHLKVIEPGVISSLKQLEELNMKNIPIKWEVERVDATRRNASLTELRNLTKLHTLYLEIQEVSLLPKDIFSENLKKYHARIGRATEYRGRYTTSLQLELPKSSMVVDYGLDKLLKRSEALCLRGFEGLTNNICELHADGFPQLKHLEFRDNDDVQSCVVNTVEDSKRAFKELEILCLKKLTNLRNICDGELTPDSFSKLKVVDVEDCDSLKNLFQSSFGFVGKVEKIRGDHGGGHKYEFLRLQKLRLGRLPKLAQLFWFQTSETTCSSSQQDSPNCLPLFDGKVAFPSLEVLYLFDLNLTCLWVDQPTPEVSYMQNLKELSVKSCHRLNYLFSFATAGCFVQLQKLEIRDCEDMEEVIVIKEAGGEELEKIILFPQLNTLELGNLPNVKRFCGASFIEFPSLRKLWIQRCPKLKTFVNNSTQDHEEILFNEKVAFPRLSSLNVGDCESSKYLLSYDTAKSLLQLMTSLVLWNCKNMEEVVLIVKDQDHLEHHRILLSRLGYLELFDLPKLQRFAAPDCIIEYSPSSFLHLNFSNCPLIGASSVTTTSTYTLVVTPTESLFNEKVAFDNKILLLQLSKTMTFRNVQELRIRSCPNFRYLLPFGGVESLKQLKKLGVWDCDGMEQIVTKAIGEDERLKKISFPKLEDVTLQGLPKLKKFCEGDSIECPSLSRLQISWCSEFRTFIPNSTTTPMLTVADLGQDVEEREPLFNEKAVFSKLERLVLRKCGEATKTIWPRQSSTVVFPNLKYLDLWSFSSVSFFDVVLRYRNLESIRLENCCLENIWQHAEEQYEYGRTLSHSLRELDLWNVSKLMHLFGIEDQENMIQAFQALETLSVVACGGLKSISMPSSVISFQNLRDLKVHKCHGLINLFDSSTAKTLVQLTSMSIAECKRLTEVIVNNKLNGDGSESDSEIVFDQLRILGLHGLPSLKSFYSCSGGNMSSRTILQFPRLRKLIVSECPEMRCFSHGHGIIVTTPCLDMVTARLKSWPEPSSWYYHSELERREAVEEVWEGDVNKGVRKLWEDNSHAEFKWLYSSASHV